MKIISNLFKFLFIFFVVTFIIYWFHLDDKLIRGTYTKYMEEYFNNMERDVRL